LGTLQKLIDRVREHEESRGGNDRAAWTAVRGAIHQALAARGSRIGTYDLRESLENARTPLPVGFVSAVSVIGDRSCLEPLAAAYARSAGGSEGWWRTHLGNAFDAITRREKLSRRHPAIRKVLARWPAILHRPLFDD
jgi:hypothetical protein